MAKHSFNKTVWQCLTLISQFGIMMLVPTGMMFALGYWLDGRLGTQFFAIVLFFVGVLAGFGNIYRLARQIYQKKDKKDRECEIFSKRSMKPSGRCGSALFCGDVCASWCPSGG